MQELAGVEGPGCGHVWKADASYSQPYWYTVKRVQGRKGSQAAPGPWKSPGYHWLVAALCVHLTVNIQRLSELSGSGICMYCIRVSMAVHTA